MASPATTDPTDQSISDGDTDYGSDFSPEVEQIVDQWISRQQIEIEDNPIVDEVEHDVAQRTLRIPRVFGKQQRSPLFQAARMAEKVAEQISNSVHREYYPDLSNQINKPSTDLEAPLEPTQADRTAPDARSPLERFRTQPRKALSVTDLVSPAWCELQYWYTLTLHGRKRRTPAMKQGIIVHKKLEEQVHTTVQVDIQTKEDAWGLRVWNVIQGLRTLRNEGQTRELEIWGIIDGLVVNGVIDELSYICPDKDLEESLHQSSTQDDPPPDQPTISEYFKPIGGTSLEANRIKRPYRTSRIYVCDVKTRSVRTLPAAVAFRPTKMQLMLYHDLLSSLATNTVDLYVLTTRYNLDPSKVFSDSFLAQVGSLNDEIFFDAQTTLDASQDSTSNWGQDSMSTLLAHNNLSALWSLMISEFQLTLPDGPASLGDVLKAEYRLRDTGEVVGSKTFVMDKSLLEAYVKAEMQWWKGEREPHGVVVEEAFKCMSCEFAEGCEWRLKKVEEAKEKVRMTRKRTAAV